MVHTATIKEKIYEHRLFITAILFVSFFYFWDLGNVNAIRQGTEGFYLQISKEMFLQKSFMTPLYMGKNHWSKPPIHFWMALTSYNIFGLSLFAARLTMAITGILGMVLMANWCKRYFTLTNTTAFLVFATSLGMLKYSRIYMMEIPLAIFSVASVLKFFDFINGKGRRDFLLATVFLAMATLVKGPVALVMCIGGCSLFVAYMLIIRKINYINALIAFAIVSVFLASLWFIASYIEHGKEFFNYFFLRENIGKFTAKSYPMRVIFQGLLIYSFPIILLIPLSIFYFKNHFKQMITIHPSKNQTAIIFLIFNFIVFFFLWFIPSQRSHHYAIPSMPLALMLIYITSMVEYEKFMTSRLFLKIAITIKIIIALILFSLVALTALAIYFLSNTSEINLSLVLGALIIEIFGLIIFIAKKHIKWSAIGTLIIFGTIWTFLIPLVSLPEIPDNVIERIKDQEVAVTLKKFYFISETIGHEVKKINPDQIKSALTAGSYVISEKEHADRQNIETQISWKVWARRLNMSQILEAIRKKRPELIQETRILISP